MPEIQYPTNPNSDTAFVVQEGGTKNRALMTAPQDTSTLELPNNPNSTKGYVTVDGKKHRVVLTANIAGGGGGGGAVDSVNGKTGAVVLTAKDVDALPQMSTMPEASASNVGNIVQYTGATNINFTNGFPYKSVNKLEHYGEVVFDDPDVLSFEGNFGDIVKYSGMPEYWEIDTCTIFYEGDHRWRFTFGEWFAVFYSDELVAYGFTVNEPQETGEYIGTITWDTQSVYVWEQVLMQGAVPQYAKLPAPSADNVGMQAMYVGEEEFETILGYLVPNRMYKVSPFTFSEPVTQVTGDFDVITFPELLYSKIPDKEGTVTFVASVSGADVTWTLDGSPVELASYGIVIENGTVADNDEITISWEPELICYTWTAGTLAGQTTQTPVLESQFWENELKCYIYYVGAPLSEDSTIIVGPAPNSIEDYVNAGIVCVYHDFENLCFTCKTIPENDIELSIAII